MDYDKTNIAENYVSGRALSHSSIESTMHVLRQIAENTEIDTIADIGCGTGRFSMILSQEFEASVFAIDPSFRMLSEARKNQMEGNIHLIRSSAEMLPLSSQSVGLAFLSMVYHHIEDKEMLVQELYRVLVPGGRVCIRNSIKDLLDTYIHLQYFPQARSYLEQVLPSGQSMIDQFESTGFKCIVRDHTETEQATSLKELYQKVERRVQSDLINISDAEFRSGLAQMLQSVNTEEVNKPIRICIAHYGFTRSEM